MSFFQNILSSVMKSTRRLNRFGSKGFGKLHNDINKAVNSVMSTTGEVSTLVYAEHLLNLIEKQNDIDLKKFLKNLLANYDIDTKKLLKDTKTYASDKNEINLKKINISSEPKWIELFRRLNSTSNGTFRLVKLRERIRALNDIELKTFDSGLLKLFKYWFNPSFLVLEKIETFFDQYIFKTALRAVLFGVLLTIMVQSSSITTSLVGPLAGAGVLSLKKIFPFTLGANIGTTITALLAALTGTVSALVGAGCHLFFNVFGILIIYGIKPLREIPLKCATLISEHAVRNKFIPLI